jgi:hypothetical protein
MSAPTLTLVAAPDFQDAAIAYDALIKRAQDILAAWLDPDGGDANHACSVLVDLLDGPAWREARQKYLLAKANAEDRRS